MLAFYSYWPIQKWIYFKYFFLITNLQSNKVLQYRMSFRSHSLLFMRLMVGKGNLTPFYDRTVFPNLCSKILPGYPTTLITWLLPGHILPGPGFAKPTHCHDCNICSGPGFEADLHLASFPPSFYTCHHHILPTNLFLSQHLVKHPEIRKLLFCTCHQR